MKGVLLMSYLQVLVEDFLVNFGDSQLREVSFYKKFENNPKKLSHLIAWAITSNGKTHAHQCRIKKTVKRYIETYIFRNFKELQKINDFELLMRVFRKVKGIGSLTAYDLAIRFGGCFGVEPKKVYLHRGTYAGARNLLGDNVSGRHFLTINELPKELQVLTPIQAEDFLCIYKKAFVDRKVPPKNCNNVCNITSCTINYS